MTHFSKEGEEAKRYRTILWLALVLNLLMFFVELVSGFVTNSLALMADAVDFFGDTVSYAVSLVVMSMAVTIRSKAALLKAVCMLGFGLYVLGRAAWSVTQPSTPYLHMATVMGVVGLLALFVNVFVAALLFNHRNGDSNRQSVWLSARNDAISNLAVLLAAIGVFGTSSTWPDLLVAGIMGLLAVSSGIQVGRQAIKELVDESNGNPLQ